MNKKLIETVGERPAPYAPLAHSFWDDPHISSQMLQAHLSADGEAATRRHEDVRKSVAWLASLAKGRLLDLGCGPGIYAEHLTREGFEVTGVDLSARSIEYAKESAAKQGLDIAYRRENYLELDETDEYDIAIQIYCDYGVLSPKDRATLLRRAYDALKEGGMLVMDVWTRNHYTNFAARRTVEYLPDGGFWTREPYLLIECDWHVPNDIYLEQYNVITENNLRTYNIWNMAFIEETLTAELEGAGFGPIAFFGDAMGNPYTERSETLCAVAYK